MLAQANKTKTITSKQRRYLRSLAHHLEPVVQIGKVGVGAVAVGEMDRALKDHELVKVRITCDDRHAFAALADELAAETGAALVQSIGRIAVYYREGDEPEIKLP